MALPLLRNPPSPLQYSSSKCSRWTPRITVWVYGTSERRERERKAEETRPRFFADKKMPVCADACARQVRSACATTRFNIYCGGGTFCENDKFGRVVVCSVLKAHRPPCACENAAVKSEP